MPERNLLILDKKESPWIPFLQEAFEDAPAKLHFFHDAQSAGTLVDQGLTDIVFAHSGLVTPALSQKFKFARQTAPDFRLFEIGEGGKPLVDLDDRFRTIPSLTDFLKLLLQHLTIQPVVRVLVVDDEHEIGTMVKDFLNNRVKPSFEVQYVDNGKKGLDAIAKQVPDVLVLDIKMPVKDGREVYREIMKREKKIPVIIFFDAISGDEMIEIHKYGRPAVVEKGSRHSAMPEMMTLIKKLAFFG